MGHTSGLYRWADERLDGGLDDQLATWRAEGLTLDQIVDELRGRDLGVSRETVRRWLKSATPSGATA